MSRTDSPSSARVDVRGDDAEPRDSAEPAADGFGEAGAKVLAVRSSGADDLEGQHGDGGFARIRRRSGSWTSARALQHLQVGPYRPRRRGTIVRALGEQPVDDGVERSGVARTRNGARADAADRG